MVLSQHEYIESGSLPTESVRLVYASAADESLLMRTDWQHPDRNSTPWFEFAMLTGNNLTQPSERLFDLNISDPRRRSSHAVSRIVKVHMQRLPPVPCQSGKPVAPRPDLGSKRSNVLSDYKTAGGQNAKAATASTGMRQPGRCPAVARS